MGNWVNLYHNYLVGNSISGLRNKNISFDDFLLN